MMSPKQHNTARGGSVDGLDCISGSFGKIESSQALERLPKFTGQIVAGRRMIRVSEDLDVWVDLLQGLPGVLSYCQRLHNYPRSGASVPMNSE